MQKVNLYAEFLKNHSLQEFVDYYKSRKSLSIALRNKQTKLAIRSLTTRKKDRQSSNDLLYLWNALSTPAELSAIQNEMLDFLFRETLLSFQQIVDKYRSVRDVDGSSCLRYLFLTNIDVFRKWFENDLLTNEECCYLLDSFEIPQEMTALLTYNSSVVERILCKNVKTFQEFVDLIKSLQDSSKNTGLMHLFKDDKFIKKLFDSGKICDSDITYLLDNIDMWAEIRYFLSNPFLVEHTLQNFLLSESHIDKFWKIIMEATFYREYRYEITNFFDYINFLLDLYLKPDDFTKMFESRQYFYLDFLKNFSENERELILSTLQKSPQSKRNLECILSNKIEGMYTDFKEFYRTLTKDDSKKRLRLNF